MSEPRIKCILTKGSNPIYPSNPSTAQGTKKKVMSWILIMNTTHSWGNASMSNHFFFGYYLNRHRWGNTCHHGHQSSLIHILVKRILRPSVVGDNIVGTLDRHPLISTPSWVPFMWYSQKTCPTLPFVWPTGCIVFIKRVDRYLVGTWDLTVTRAKVTCGS